MQPSEIESVYVGRALASLSHELKNVLAIVGEAAGLMEDRLDLAQDRGTPLPAPLSAHIRKGIDTIMSQAARGQGLASELNTVAHLPDSRAAGEKPDVDMGRIAALACRLTLRKAAQREVFLQPPAHCGTARPADPQHCLAACLGLLHWVMDFREPGGSICVRPHDDGVGVLFDATPPADTLGPDVAALIREANLELHETPAGIVLLPSEADACAMPATSKETVHV